MSKKEFINKYKLEKKQRATDNIPCGSGLAGKICAHNNKKLNKKIVKSEGATIDFKDTTSTVNAQMHMAAEQSASPELIAYLTASINADLQKIRLAKGMLTLNKKDAGLYSGFFQDEAGQVIQEFDNMTIPILAKNLEVKELYQRPIVAAVHSDATEDEELIEEEMDEHVAMYHQGQNSGEAIKQDKGYVRIKYGNFELEIKKSMHDFIKSFGNTPNKEDVRKALSAWRRNSRSASQFRSDMEAAQALVLDWNRYGEEFEQILFASKMKHEKQ